MLFLFNQLFLYPIRIFAATGQEGSITQSALDYFVGGDLKLDGMTHSISTTIITVLGIIVEIVKLSIGVIENSTIVSLSHEKIGNGWSYSMFIVNIFAIFILLAIAFANTLRINLETYAIKKTLPSLIIGFVMANLSLLVSKALLDFSDLLTQEINSLFITDGTSLIETLVNRTTGFKFSPDKSNILEAIFAVFSSKNGGTGMESGLGEILVKLDQLGSGADIKQIILIIELCIIALFFILPAIVILAIAFVTIARQIILYVLIILAPIAIILMSFPPTKGIGQKWLGQYLTWIFVIPLILFIIGIATIFLPENPQKMQEMLTHAGSLSAAQSANFFYAIVGYISGIFVLVAALMIPLSLSGSGGSMISNMLMYNAMAQGGNILGGLFGRGKGGNTSNVNTNVGGQGMGGGISTITGSGGGGQSYVPPTSTKGKTFGQSAQEIAKLIQQPTDQPQSIWNKVNQKTPDAQAFEQSSKPSPMSEITNAGLQYEKNMRGFQSMISNIKAQISNPQTEYQSSPSPSYPSSSVVSAAAGALAGSTALSEIAVGSYGQALLKSNAFTPEQIKQLQTTPPEKIGEVLASRSFNANLNNTISVSQNNLGQYLDSKQVSANNTVTLGELAKSYNQKFNDAAKSQATSIGKDTKLNINQIKQVSNILKSGNSTTNIQAALQAANGDQRITNLINTVDKNPGSITYVNNTLDKLIQVKESQATSSSSPTTPVPTTNVVNQNITNAVNNFAANTSQERVAALQTANAQLASLDTTLRKINIKNVS